jgi:hypothetical protein
MGKALEDVVHHLLRQVGREVGDLVGLECLGGRHELVRVHRRDKRLADRVGDLEQDVAVARGAHAVPDVEPLVERKRLEDVRDVRRMQPVELALQRRHAFLVHLAVGEQRRLRGLLARTFLALLAHEPLDQPMLAQKARHVRERILNALRRVGTGDDIGIGGWVMRPAILRGRGPARGRQGTTAAGMRAIIVATRPRDTPSSGRRSKSRGLGVIAASFAACST